MRVALYVFLLLSGVFVASAFAQEGIPPDWESLGVNTGIIAGIITITQIVKQFFPDNLKKYIVIVPIVLSAGVFFVAGGNQPAENVLFWAAAAAYLFKVGQQAGKVLKGT